MPKSPKKTPKKKKGGEEAELEEDALEEWLSRGFNKEDFTLDKMLRIWMLDDQANGIDEDDEDNEASLEAKLELMQSYYLLNPILQRGREKKKQLQNTLRTELQKADKAWTAFKDYVELPPLKRRRLIREYAQRVKRAKEQAKQDADLKKQLQEQMDEELRAERELKRSLRKRYKSKSLHLNRLRELKEIADRKVREDEYEMLRLQKQARLDEKQDLKANALQKQNQIKIRQEVERRQQNDKFWEKEKQVARRHANEQIFDETRHQALEADVMAVKDEVRLMGEGESNNVDDTPNRPPSYMPTGIFGTDFTAGEWKSAIEGGHKSGLDEHTIGVFSGRSFRPEVESLRHKVIVAESKVTQAKQALDGVARTKVYIQEERKKRSKEAEKLKNELNQIAVQYAKVADSLSGPPRRDAEETNKVEFHELARRRQKCRQSLRDLEEEDLELQRQMEKASSKETSVIATLESRQVEYSKLAKRLEDMDGNVKTLPVVMGKGILAPNLPHGEPPSELEKITMIHQDPTSMYRQVTMSSKLEIFKVQAEPAKNYYKDVKRTNVAAWKANEERDASRYELEGAATRLANLRNSIVEQRQTSLRADLTQAILRFHNGPHKLRERRAPQCGIKSWKDSISRTRTFNICFPSNTNIFHVENVMETAQLRGRLELPKLCAYKVTLATSIMRLDLDTGAMTKIDQTKVNGVHLVHDMVLYTGTSDDSIWKQDLKTDINEASDGYSKTFEFRGARLYFCFAFTPQKAMQKDKELYCLVVDDSFSYKELVEDFRLEEARTRALQQESHIVSEMVKTLRAQFARSNSERCGKLIKELVNVEESKAKTCDSKVLHGHLQRFKRSEYTKLLRVEIKKEIAMQIDQDIATRKKQLGNIASDGNKADSTAHKNQSIDTSRTKYQERRVERIQPTIQQAVDALGQYCTFKSAAANAPAAQPSFFAECSIVSGVRLEWRQGRTDLKVAHQLISVASTSRMKSQMLWTSLEKSNSVLISSEFNKLLQLERSKKRQDEAIDAEKLAQLAEVENEREVVLKQHERIARSRFLHDINDQTYRQQELHRRRWLFYMEAMRLTTYNERISSQINFRVNRMLKALKSDDSTPEVADRVTQKVKEDFANQYVTGKMAFINKTWDRKKHRAAEDRLRLNNKHRAELNALDQRVLEIELKADKEKQRLQKESQAQLKQKLQIPDFERAIGGRFSCEHRHVRAWGNMYGSGSICRSCGKEMSKSFDDPDHGRGADPQLDEDVLVHRAQATSGLGFHFQNAGHLKRVEDERLRLEKEWREMELSETMLYDWHDAKAIVDFNFRHNIARNDEVDHVSSAHPLYTRYVREMHQAAFKDDMLFFGRLYSFCHRIERIKQELESCKIQLIIQKDFLCAVQRESDIIDTVLPVVEYDRARAQRLVHEDKAARKNLKIAREQLPIAKIEYSAAKAGIQGVEEDAEHAERYVPAIVQSSEEMKKLLERSKTELECVKTNITKHTEALGEARLQNENNSKLLCQLGCRIPNAIFQTPFGIAKVNYYRSEDTCVVMNCLEWQATFVIPMEELLAIEAMRQEEAQIAMEYEDKLSLSFLQYERRIAEETRVSMEKDEKEIRYYRSWKESKDEEDAVVLKAVCEEELKVYFQYQNDPEFRKSLHCKAKEKAKAARKEELEGKPKTIKVRLTPAPLAIMWLTKTWEKQLVLDLISERCSSKTKEIRDTYRRSRDDKLAATLQQNLYHDVVHSVVLNLVIETTDKYQESVMQSLRLSSSAAVTLNGGEDITYDRSIYLGRLWMAKSKAAQILYTAWKTEHDKLDVLRMEIQRREEVARKAEEERQRIEAMQREMQREERYCQAFYLEEMMFMMRERKAMAQAEEEMRFYIRQLEIEAMKTKYAQLVDDRNRPNSKIARRLEIKHGKNEQHRLHKEWAFMKEEDDLSSEVRELERKEAEELAQRELHERYMAHQAVKGQMSASMVAFELDEHLKEMQRREVERKVRFEEKLLQERMIATVETYFAISRNELAVLKEKERMAFWTRQLEPLSSNVEKMNEELELLMKERQHVEENARAKREHATICQKRYTEAREKLSEAVKLEEHCSEIYAKVHKTNSITDSEVLHGRPQRFRTKYLLEQLHARYFSLITESIIRRAIAISTEKEKTMLEGKISSLLRESSVKRGQLHVLQRKRRRSYYMRTKRSELGKIMFRSSQRKLMEEKFKRWVEIWSTRVTVRASFDVKFGQAIQRQRLLSETVQASEEQCTRLTVLQKHHKRKIRCRMCQSVYTEEQNHRFSCTYHPGTYEMACIKSCQSRQAGSCESNKLKEECMMHRAKRWLCCDNTQEGRFGSSGCRYRHHLPQRADPSLEEMVIKKSVIEQERMAKMEQELTQLKERNVAGRLKSITKTSIASVARSLADKRAVASKYHVLDKR